ncbi:MAG: cupin domain-containing protein [Solirubrobacteraceae bacterium]
MAVSAPQPETMHLAASEGIPNSPLPVLVYPGVEGAGDAASAEALFAGNGWLGAWRDGIFDFHHFHSTAHEVLAITAGSATVALGGPDGETVEVSRGDVLVLPAGTGHRNLGSSDDLLVVGAYPDGMSWDIRRGDPAELDEVKANIAAVPLPGADPVHGAGGPLGDLWNQ